MDNQKKFDLITKNTEEVLTEADLKTLIADGMPIKHYIGFEISGLVHLGTGIVCMQKLKDFQEAEVECSILLADWHSWINDKLGGNRENIRNIGVSYFKEGLIAGMKCVGVDPARAKFVLGSDLYHNNDDYFATIVEIGKNTTLARVKRSMDIMGRQAHEEVDFARLIYPPMQVADIFIQGLNLVHGGIDQRKAHVLARMVAPNLTVKPVKNSRGENIKPVAIHHSLLLGLQKPPIYPVPKDKIRDVWVKAKMSKSIPNSAIFIHDRPEKIREKIMGAFCPEGDVDFNPIIDWVKSLIFQSGDKEFVIKRPEKFGGTVTYTSVEEVKSDFANKKLHPQDLKMAVTERLIDLLEPARKHFEIQENRELLQRMQELLITR